MRKALVLVSLVLFLACSANFATTPMTDSSVVWVTRTGNKYHKASCRTIKKSKGLTSMTKTEARNKGYTACSVCKP